MALMGADAQICAFERQLLFHCNNAMVRSFGRKIEYAAISRQSAATVILHRVQ